MILRYERKLPDTKYLIVKLSFIYIFYFTVSEDKSRTKKIGGVNRWRKWIVRNRSGVKWKHLFINRNRDLIKRNQNIKTNTSQTCAEFEPFFDSSIIHRHGPERWPVARSFPSITSNKDKRFSIYFFQFPIISSNVRNMHSMSMLSIDSFCYFSFSVNNHQWLGASQICLKTLTGRNEDWCT